MSYRLYSIATLSLMCMQLHAQDNPRSIVADIEADSTITITQPARLESLLQRPTVSAVKTEEESHASHEGESAVRKSRVGYRVLIYEDNNPLSARRSAEGYHSRMQTDYPYLRSYISFNSPYWRVKVGDFRSRAEAEGVLAELKHAFPGIAPYMRIVRDKINSND